MSSDSYYENFKSDYAVQEKATVDDQKEQDSLIKLLSLPYPALFEELKRAASDLKQTIVVETRGFTGAKATSLYLGTSFLLLESHLVINNKNDLDLCFEIIKDCDSAPSNPRVVCFLLGRVGVCALGAVVANHQGNSKSGNYPRDEEMNGASGVALE